MTPTTHDLNKCLADVAGVEVHEWNGCQPHKKYWKCIGGVWDALTDHNQMALVKAALREQGWEYDVSVKQGDCIVWLYKSWPDAFKGTDPEELLAFALAVWKMKHEKTTI